MLRNITITAIRNFIRQPFFATVNVVGLAIGVACSLLIIVYVWHESSYDNFHPDADKLYRVNQTNIWSPDGGQMSSTVIPLAAALEEEFPEVEATLRINNPGEQLVQYGDESFYEKNVLAVDSNFFSFFGFHLLQGNPTEALTGINKVVISEEVRDRLFKDEPALGKTLLFGENKTPVVISGVAASVPTNAHFSFDYLLSISTNPLIEEFSWSWIMNPLVTYVKLKSNASASQLEKKLEILAPKYIPPTFDRLGMDYEGFVADKGGWNFYLQPVQDIHLYSAGIGNRIGEVGDIKYIYVFSVVGVFLLVLGCINFINLSTARASSRAKEVGVRKVLGSYKKQLIAQYILESIFLCFLATILGVALMEMLRLILQNFVAIEFTYNWNQLWPFLVIFPIALGVTAGIYPAFYLTAFEPAKVLKGNLRSGMKSAGFRNILVITQFTTAIILIVATVIVQQQLSYLNSKDLGFNRENIMVIDHADRLGNNLQSFRNLINNQSNIISASIAMDIPGRGTYEDMFTRYGDDKQLSMNQLKIDPDFFKTMGLELLAGELFREDAISDHNKIIVNESAIKWFGWDKDTAIGQYLNYPGDDMGKLEVIGVVKDFNFESLREPIKPLVFFHHQSTMWGDNRVIAIRYQVNKEEEALGTIESLWGKISDAPFSYSFLDAEYESLYMAEKRLGNLFSIFTFLTIIIAVIGLFGLTTYALEQRAKEISIRKIFGAGKRQLLLLFTKEYMALIVIAFVIAIPLSLYGMQQWLNSFAYHMTPGYVSFGIAAALIITIVGISAGFKILQAAIANPVDNLANE
ncbi:MAG: ABC transporter permease [Candidatus Cyclobacteriaceae bacterium M2_1C_046]